MFDFEKPVTEVEQKVEEAKDEEKAEQDTQQDALNRDKETVPLSALMKAKEETKAERRKRLELEQRIAASEAEREKAAEVGRLVDDLGYTEEVAKREVDVRFTDKRRLDEMERRFALREIRDLPKEGSLYADADKYADEIYAEMKRHNIDAKKAYLMVCDSDALELRLKESQTQQEQRNLLKRREAEEKQVESSSPTRPSSPHRLSESDRDILKELQKAQPDMGWTVDTYWQEVYGKTAPKE